MTEKPMTQKRTWEEFRSTGLLLIINQLLQIFGWSIAVEFSNEGTITGAYPIRTRFRGFSEGSQTQAYELIQKYLKENIEDLEEDLK